MPYINGIWNGQENGLTQEETDRLYTYYGAAEGQRLAEQMQQTRRQALNLNVLYDLINNLHSGFAEQRLQILKIIVGDETFMKLATLILPPTPNFLADMTPEDPGIPDQNKLEIPTAYGSIIIQRDTPGFDEINFDKYMETIE